MPTSQNRGYKNDEERSRARAARKKRIRRNRIIFGSACLLVLVLLVSGVVKLVSGGGEEIVSSSGASSENTAGEEAASSAASEETAPALAGVDTRDWRMILVNNNVPLPSGYEVETEVAETATGKELQKEAAQAYRQMDKAADAEGVDLLLCSGYRSVEYQTGLFEDEKQEYLDKGHSEQEAYDLAKTVVAVPGHSEHNCGLAADIVTPSYQNLDSGFEDTEAFEWLDKHAAEYGFILRYPEDKQAITGIIYEPWHYRYVGPENAKLIKESGLCLEEVHGLAE